GSDQLATHERHLTRYFEREYKRLLEHPVSLQSLGISTDRGPMSEETKALMESHYDERSEFFASFLDRQYMAYTMAYYGETPGEIRVSSASLEEAQRAKFALIAERAGIKGHERILNIGCGFGPLETFLFNEFPDLDIVGVTPSKVQASHLRQRMQNPHDLLSKGHFNLLEGTFDQIPLERLGSVKYDLIITVGLFEHVLNMQFVMERISKLLIPGGKSFHHFISSKIVIPQFLYPDKTRIGIYFPGGRAWPTDALIQHAGQVDSTSQWFVNGLNYWRTLDEWHRRYWENIPSLYKSVFDIKAIAHWNEYFSLCKAVFAPMEGAVYGNSHYLFKKPG
ncbi:MAG: class I SAM-dependent methyltransferase, partial [Gammaproteobacteria bacterium]